jgi:raffinose/stachyose/melibiose transport system permease protein
MAFVSAMVIPFQVLMYPLVRWMRVIGEFLHFRLLGTVGGIVFAYLGFGSPLSIFIFHGFIKNIPLEIEESATIDGCRNTISSGLYPRFWQPIISQSSSSTAWTERLSIAP